MLLLTAHYCDYFFIWFQACQIQNAVLVTWPFHKESNSANMLSASQILKKAWWNQFSWLVFIQMYFFCLFILAYFVCISKNIKLINQVVCLYAFYLIYFVPISNYWCSWICTILPFVFYFANVFNNIPFYKLTLI